MHETTQSNLETLARWTADTARADRYVTNLQERLPADVEDGIYASFGNSFGNLSLTIYEADAISDVTPYLRAVREAGFERLGEAKENPTADAVSWQYRIKEGDKMVTLGVSLNLKSSGGGHCRYVQVGVKEVPEMKLICGEELAEYEAREAEAAE